MRTRSRAWAVTAILAGALALLGPAAAHAAAGEDVDRGVVQAVSQTAITLRALDGTSVTVAVGSHTVIRVNGRAADVTAVRPGFVVTAFHAGDAPARLVRAFGTLARRIEQGTIVAASRRLLTIRTIVGGTIEIRLGARTLIRRANGIPARRGALRPGRTARVTYVPGLAADLVVVARG